MQGAGGATHGVELTPYTGSPELLPIVNATKSPLVFDNSSTARTYHRTPPHVLDLPKADLFPTLYDLGHVAERDPYHLHDL